MQRLSLVFAVAVATTLSATAWAQEGDQQNTRPTEQQKVVLEKTLQAVQQRLETITFDWRTASSAMLGPVVTGAPYSATTTSESIQMLVDGNRIVNRTTYNAARDGQGRVRREEVADTGAVVSIMIMDPVAGSSYVLDPASRTARKVPLVSNSFVRTGTDLSFTTGMVSSSGAITLQAVPKSETVVGEVRAKRAIAGNMVDGGSIIVSASPASLRRETLGTQELEGVTVDGTRSVSTIAAGEIGNERPIDTVDEQWYSKDLQMTIMSRHSDPRIGERTYRVTNLRRGEPDPSLFQVPGDYTVKEPVTEVLRQKVVK